MRAPTADLEFDLMSSQGLDEPRSSMQPIGKKSAPRRNEIDFGAEPGAGSLELDVGPARTDAAERLEPAWSASSERTVSSTSERSAMNASPKPAVADPSSGDRRSETFVPRMPSPEIPRAAGPMSRAEVVHKPGIDNSAERTRRRQLSLLRVLGAVGIGAIGYVLDSSIVYGNANLLSVLAHAVAIYQLGIGLRGLTS
jgi:hypothetical protein